MRKVEKCCIAGRAINDNMAHAHCMLWCLRLQTHKQNMKYLRIFHCNSGCKKASHCYVIRRLRVLVNNCVAQEADVCERMNELI